MHRKPGLFFEAAFYTRAGIHYILQPQGISGLRAALGHNQNIPLLDLAVNIVVTPSAMLLFVVSFYSSENLLQVR